MKSMLPVHRLFRQQFHPWTTVPTTDVAVDDRIP